MSDFESADLTVARRRVILDTIDRDPEEPLTNLGPPEGHEPPPREGLPGSYRMRADAHYVDTLLSRRAEAIAARPAGSTPPDSHPAVPNVPGEWRDRRESRERRTERVLMQLAEDVATIESAAGLLDAGASPMARRASADLIRAHAWRAAWLIRANTILAGTHRSQVHSSSIAALLLRVREGFAAECRVTGVALQVQAPDAQAAVMVDEPALVAGLSGALVATLGLLTPEDGTVVKVTAVTLAGELRTIDVSQDAMAVPATVAARFFDASWSDRPGGWLAAVGAATAKAVAAQHGGDATFVARDRRGGTLRLTFNRTP